MTIKDLKDLLNELPEECMNEDVKIEGIYDKSMCERVEINVELVSTDEDNIEVYGLRFNANTHLGKFEDIYLVDDYDYKIVKIEE